MPVLFTGACTRNTRLFKEPKLSYSAHTHTCTHTHTHTHTCRLTTALLKKVKVLCRASMVASVDKGEESGSTRLGSSLLELSDR